MRTLVNGITDHVGIVHRFTPRGREFGLRLLRTKLAEYRQQLVPQDFTNTNAQGVLEKQLEIKEVPKLTSRSALVAALASARPAIHAIPLKEWYERQHGYEKPIWLVGVGASFTTPSEPVSTTLGTKYFKMLARNPPLARSKGRAISQHRLAVPNPPAIKRKTKVSTPESFFCLPRSHYLSALGAIISSCGTDHFHASWQVG